MWYLADMARNSTTGELLKAKTVTEDEIVAAVDVYMADPSASLFQFADGHSLDVAAAVETLPLTWAKAIVANLQATEELRRAAVRAAILLARPEKA